MLFFASSPNPLEALPAKGCRAASRARVKTRLKTRYKIKSILRVRVRDFQKNRVQPAPLRGHCPLPALPALRAAGIPPIMPVSACSHRPKGRCQQPTDVSALWRWFGRKKAAPSANGFTVRYPLTDVHCMASGHQSALSYLS